MTQMTATQVAILQDEPILYPVKSPRREANKLVVYVGVNYGLPDPRCLLGSPCTDNPILEGLYELYDPYESDPERRHKLMRLDTVSRVRTGGVIQTQRRTKFVEFDNGVKRLNADRDYDLYRFLHCHPRNQDGPYFDRSKPAIFKLLHSADSSAKTRPSLSQMELEVIAFQSAKNLTSTQCHAMAAELHAAFPEQIDNIASLPKNQVREAVAFFAKQHPEKYLRLTVDLAAQVRYAIETAKLGGDLLFDENKRQWFLSKKKVVDVSPAQNPENTLVLYLVPTIGEKDEAKRVATRDQLFTIANFEVKDAQDEEEIMEEEIVSSVSIKQADNEDIV